jgi:hypothetical protein
MRAKHIIGHIFFAYLAFLNLIIGIAGIDEFGAAWLWLGIFFSGAFILGLQTHLLWRKTFTVRKKE